MAVVFLISRQDRLEDIARRNRADLPRIYVELKALERNFTVNAGDDWK